MVFSNLDQETGRREFPLRERYRVLVFTGPDGWAIHETDVNRRNTNCYRLLSFSDVEDRLSDQPNALAEARLLEQQRLS